MNRSLELTTSIFSLRLNINDINFKKLTNGANGRIKILNLLDAKNSQTSDMSLCISQESSVTKWIDD